MSTPAIKPANPAVVGLAGFGLTTLVLQFHNVGWAGNGPVIWLGLVFGGLAQMIAGFQEQKMGNSFGYSAFVSYGAFWIALCLMLLGNHFGIFKASTTDIGWFLVAYTLYTAIMWAGAIRIHSAMAWTFTLLLVGFILLDIGHFGFPICNQIAGCELMLCALSAWYMMASIILNEVYGRVVLPCGKPWVAMQPSADSARLPESTRSVPEALRA
jgi:succinate-acetate transporter protein